MLADDYNDTFPTRIREDPMSGGALNSTGHIALMPSFTILAM